MPPLPPGPYRVIYADPPWQYHSDKMRQFGQASRHYPTLSIAQLAQIPVRRLVGKDAVLFLWVTGPLLAECFPVIRAWGFTYKTNIVWNKMRHNWGRYTSSQHEHLLLCTRGSCPPSTREQFPSVVPIPRQGHSVKPAAFRTLIDTLYPEGPRLELFARTRAEGWEAWGNDICDVSGQGKEAEHA